MWDWMYLDWFGLIRRKMSAPCASCWDRFALEDVTQCKIKYISTGKIVVRYICENCIDNEHDDVEVLIRNYKEE